MVMPYLFTLIITFLMSFGIELYKVAVNSAPWAFFFSLYTVGCVIFLVVVIDDQNEDFPFIKK
jgi:hypothetical protein